MSQCHDAVINALKSAIPPGMTVEVPPRQFREMRGNFTGYTPNKTLACAFPAQEQHANCLGQVSGGALAAAVDNTYNAFGFLVAKRPCELITMDMSYIRPMAADSGIFSVEARLRAKSRSVLFMEAKVMNDEGKTVATSTATVTIAPSK